MKKLLLLFTLFTLNVFYAQTELLSSVDQFYNGTSWENNYGENYEYDANNNLISTTSFGWSNGTWEESFKDIYTYNANNQVTSVLSQDYDSNTNTYTNAYRTTNTYDSNGIVTYLDETWNGSQWVNEYKLDLSYVGGALDIVIAQQWNGSSWDNDGRFVVTNDSNNQIIELVDEFWENNNWVVDGRTVIARNTNGIIVSQTYEIWNGSAYEEDGGYVYSIDSNGNRTSDTESFDAQTFITNYTYDNSELMSSFAHPFADKGLDYLFESFPYFNKILSREDGNNTSRTVYNYDSALILNVGSVEMSNNFSIYPNPVKTDLNIETSNTISNIEIYNILGRRVMITQSNKINLEHLSDGVYTLKVRDNQGNESIKKFIKN